MHFHYFWAEKEYGDERHTLIRESKKKLPLWRSFSLFEWAGIGMSLMLMFYFTEETDLSSFLLAVSFISYEGYSFIQKRGLSKYYFLSKVLKGFSIVGFLVVVFLIFC